MRKCTAESMLTRATSEVLMNCFSLWGLMRVLTQTIARFCQNGVLHASFSRYVRADCRLNNSGESAECNVWRYITGELVLREINRLS